MTTMSTVTFSARCTSIFTLLPHVVCAGLRGLPDCQPYSSEMATNLKRILKVLEKWPIDHSKAGRDLGEFLRTSLKKAHKEGRLPTDLEYWDRQYLSLVKLINNEYRNKYPRVRGASATGLDAEQCHVAMSNEFLEHLQEEEEPYYRKIFRKKHNKEEGKS